MTELHICVGYCGLNKLTMIYPLPTLFTDKIINEVEGHKCYSFIDGFSTYNQVTIAEEDREKTTFVTVFGCSTYRVMPFGLKNPLAVFS